MASAAKDLADWDLKNLIAFVIDEFGCRKQSLCEETQYQQDQTSLSELFAVFIA